MEEKQLANTTDILENSDNSEPDADYSTTSSSEEEPWDFHQQLSDSDIARDTLDLNSAEFDSFGGDETPVVLPWLELLFCYLGNKLC